MTQEEKTTVIEYTLAGLEILKDYFTEYQYLTGTWAQKQYEGLLETEHLAKRYLIETENK